jgi:hypothetical protein
MQETNNIIVIFTQDHKIGATIALSDSAVVPTITDQSVEIEISRILSELKTKNPSLHMSTIDTDGNQQFGFTEVPPTDPRYLEAVVEECNQRNLRAALVSEPLLKILELITEKMPPQVLEKQLGDFLSMTAEEAQTFYSDLQEAADILKTPQ